MPLPSNLTLNLPAANALGSGVGQRKTIKHISTTGTLIVTPNGSDSIRLGNTTVSTLTLNPGDCYLLTSTGGTFWEVIAALTNGAAGGVGLLAANNLSDVANAGTSRTNLGVAIGTNVQAHDSDLDTIAGLTATTDSIMQSKSSAWAARTLAQVAADLQGTSSTTLAAGNDSRFTTVVPNVQSGTTYTFVPSDAGKVVEGTNASAKTFTIDTHANQAIPVNSVIEVFQDSATQITIAAAGGVTLKSDGSKVKTAAQNATIGLRQQSTDVWIFFRETWPSMTPHIWVPKSQPLYLPGREVQRYACMPAGVVSRRRAMNPAGGGLSYDTTILAETSLVHYWKMNEASGQIADSKGSQPSNSAGGTPTYSQSAIFAGSTSSILFAGGDSFSFTANWGTNANYTFECFVRATSVSAVMYVMLNGISTSPGYNALNFGTGGDIEWDNRFGPTLTGMGTISAATAYHIVLTYDNPSKTAIGYINGSGTSKTHAGTQDTPGAGAKIGISPAGGGSSGFSGRISNAAYYNAVLTPTQIAAHYAARNTP